MLLGEAPRNPVQETALRAVSCTPGTPRSHARPRLVDRARSCHGTRSRSRERPKATPDHQVSCFAPERIYVVRHPCAGQGPLRSDSYGGPARPRPMDRAGPSTPKTGDYVCRDALRRSRSLTPSMALRRVQAAAGGSREPPLAWTLKEPAGVSDGASHPLPHLVARLQRLPQTGETCSKGMHNIS